MSILKLFLNEMSMTSISQADGEGYNEPLKEKKKKKKKKNSNAVVRYGFYGILGRDYKPVQVPEEDKEKDIDSDSGSDGGGGGE